MRKNGGRSLEVKHRDVAPDNGGSIPLDHPKLKIYAHDVDLILLPSYEIDSECNEGWARWGRNQIVLASDVPQTRLESNFFHEVLHLINVYMPEREVAYLSDALYDFLSRNDLLNRKALKRYTTL